MSKTITGTGDNTGFELEDKSVFRSYLERYNQSNNMELIQVGDKISGTVTSKSEKYTFVDISNKSNAIIENSVLENMILDKVQVGETVDIVINKITDNKEYTIYGSAYQFLMMGVEDYLNQAKANKTVLTGIVTNMNFAGYTVSVNINDQDINLFMPHLLTDVNKLPDPEAILNCEIDFLLDVTTSDKDGQKSLVASRKAFLNKLAEKEITKIIKGNLYVGFVTGVTDFAVFVQFNDCLTGMIHKSNLEIENLKRLEANEIVPGMSIQFYVKDRIKNKLFLTQELKDSLWDKIEVNQKLTGTVSNIKEFGLLVNLDYETKGLLHESVLPKTKTYKVGETVEVVVTQVNKNKRQITLNLSK